MNAPRIAPSIDRAELVRRAIEREVIRLHGAACVLHALRATPLDGLAWSRITADLDHARSLGERIDRLVILACAHMSMAEVDEAAVHLATLAGLSLDEWVMREGRAL